MNPTTEPIFHLKWVSRTQNTRAQSLANWAALSQASGIVEPTRLPVDVLSVISL